MDKRLMELLERYVIAHERMAFALEVQVGLKKIEDYKPAEPKVVEQRQNVQRDLSLGRRD